MMLKGVFERVDYGFFSFDLKGLMYLLGNGFLLVFQKGNTNRVLVIERLWK